MTLTCPVCGKTYDNYGEYFACWTGHLDEKINGDKSSSTLAPFEHGEAIIFYKNNPQLIEKHLRMIASEVGVFHGRIDLIAVDRERRLVLIDIDNGHDPTRKAHQLQRYKKAIHWMGTHIFGIRASDLPPIRLIIIDPNKYIKEVSS